MSVRELINVVYDDDDAISNYFKTLKYYICKLYNQNHFTNYFLCLSIKIIFSINDINATNLIPTPHSQYDTKLIMIKSTYLCYYGN